MPNAELTVEEIAALSRKLTADIQNLLIHFTTETGMCVDYIAVNPLVQLDGQVASYVVDVDVKLNPYMHKINSSSTKS